MLERGMPQRLHTLIMPNVFALSDAHLSKIEEFVRRGGRLIASGLFAACDQWGTPALPSRQARLERLLGARLQSADFRTNPQPVTMTTAVRATSNADFYHHRFGEGHLFYTDSPIAAAAF